MSSRLTSAIATVTLSGLIVLLMLLVSGYSFDPKQYEEQHPPKDPPEGFEISLGTHRGMGDTPAASANTQTAASNLQPAASSTATQAESTAKTSIADNNNTSNTTIQQPEQTPQQPDFNPNASLTAEQLSRIRNKNKGTGSGATDTPGNTGNNNGSQTSTPAQGTGGNGVSGNIPGRKAENLAIPTNKTGKQGRVVIAVCVNKEGVNTRAEYQPQGSNTSDLDLINIAVRSARKVRFNPTSVGDDEQCGTITYTFVIGQ